MLQLQKSQQATLGIVGGQTRGPNHRISQKQAVGIQKQQFANERVQNGWRDGQNQCGMEGRHGKENVMEKVINLIFEEERIIKNNIRSIENIVFGKVQESIMKDFVYHVYRGATYALQKLTPPSLQFIKSREILLKEPSVHKKFLVLGLDAVTVYTEKQAAKNGQKNVLKLQYRPYLFPFLEQMSEHYDIFIFSGEEKGYCHRVVEKLNQGKKYVKDVLWREHCFRTKRGKLIKDLRIIKNRDLKDIVIVDCAVQSFGLQLSNGVPLVQFKGSNEDRQLEALVPFLVTLSQVEDVRVQLQKRLHLSSLGEVEWSRVDKHFQFDCINGH